MAGISAAPTTVPATGAATLKLCVTLGAAATFAFPACAAVIEHVPVPVRWTVEPETVQLPDAV